MFHPISWLARGAQIMLVGFLGALGFATLQAWPRLADNSEAAVMRIASIAAPAFILLVMTQIRRTRLLAVLITFGLAAALVFYTEPFLTFLGL